MSLAAVAEAGFPFYGSSNCPGATKGAEIRAERRRPRSDYVTRHAPTIPMPWRRGDVEPSVLKKIFGIDDFATKTIIFYSNTPTLPYLPPFSHLCAPKNAFPQKWPFHRRLGRQGRGGREKSATKKDAPSESMCGKSSLLCPEMGKSQKILIGFRYHGIVS